MVKYVKTHSKKTTSHIGMFESSATLLPIQSPAHVPGKTENDVSFEILSNTGKTDGIRGD